MATEMGLTDAEKLFSAFDSEEIKKVCATVGYVRQLEELKNSMAPIKQHLHAPQSSGASRELTQDCKNKLKKALHHLDELLAEINGRAQRSTLVGVKAGILSLASRSKKVKSLLFCSNEFLHALMKTSVSAADDACKSDFYYRGREETISFVDKEEIIGRDHDKEKIVNMLLGTDVDKYAFFVTIVGPEGIGKTTLTQLVYNDDRILSMFQLRMWVHVGDDFSMKTILCKVLKSIAFTSFDNNLEQDQLQEEVRTKLGGKRYLLILDDVYEESRYKWDELIEFFNFCGKGCQIMVTTPFKYVAKAIGKGIMYPLGTLSDHDSWLLLKHLAFPVRHEPDIVAPNLVDIGKAIVKKCDNVPLLIKLTALLLSCQDRDAWLECEKDNNAFLLKRIS